MKTCKTGPRHNLYIHHRLFSRVSRTSLVPGLPTSMYWLFWLSRILDCPWSPALNMNKKGLFQDISKEHIYVQGNQHKSLHVHSIQKANKILFSCPINRFSGVKLEPLKSLRRTIQSFKPQMTFIWRHLTFKTDNFAKNSESRTFQNWFWLVQ